MAATRKYYEQLLDHFDAICKLEEGDYPGLKDCKMNLINTLTQIKKYHLFNINLPETFETVLLEPAVDFHNERSLIAKSLYLSLGYLLFSFEMAKPFIDYGKSLEISRTELPFKTISEWNLVELPENESGLENLFFQLYSKAYLISTSEDYNNYKQRLRAQKGQLRKSEPETPVDPNLLERSRLAFENQLKRYKDFILTNYPEITEEFTFYNANIRIYLIPDVKLNDEIIQQVNFYKPANNPGIFIYPNYIDFAARFHNLEEIEQQPLSGYVGLFDTKHPEKYANFFSIYKATLEINELFLGNAEFDELKHYLVFLLRAQLIHVGTSDSTADILTIRSPEKNGFCKLLFNDLPNVEELKTIVKMDSDNYFDFIAFNMRPDTETLNFLKSVNIKPFILQFLSKQHIDNQNKDLINLYIKSRIHKLTKLKKNPVYITGAQLLKRLENCPTGLKGWQEYETLCLEIFNYLFQNDFRNYTYRIQSYTHDKIFRRDLIVNNNFIDPTGFWSQVKNDFNCNIIVVDFKNYSEPLEQNEFYLPSKYLNLVTGKFGIVFSRKGLGNSAKILQTRMLNRDNELLICLSDDDLIGMINEKMAGNDPSYRLDNLKFQLYELG